MKLELSKAGEIGQREWHLTLSDIELINFTLRSLVDMTHVPAKELAILLAFHRQTPEQVAAFDDVLRAVGECSPVLAQLVREQNRINTLD